MSVIPAFVIDNWKKQYDEGSALWQQYPEFDVQDRNVIRLLAARDEAIISHTMNTHLTSGLPKPSQAAPLYLASAGAPLAGKSTILDFRLAASPGLESDAVMIDPDRKGMTYMSNLYHGYLLSAGMVANVPSGEGYAYAQRRAYDIARPASNYITLELMNQAIENKNHIVHGTTMTSPYAGGLLKNISDQGYEIELMLCGAPDDMRAKAATYRAEVQGYYQSTPEDVKSKGEDFPKRLKDYFTHADRMHIFWRTDVTENAVNAATFENGTMRIRDNDAMAAFGADYEAKRKSIVSTQPELKDDLPSMSELANVYAHSFKRRRGRGRTM